MTAPDPRDAEIAALREEIAELRARLAVIEDALGLHAAAAAPPDEVGAGPPEASIEPGEPWNLGPPGTGGAQP